MELDEWIVRIAANTLKKVRARSWNPSFDGGRSTRASDTQSIRMPIIKRPILRARTTWNITPAPCLALQGNNDLPTWESIDLKWRWLAREHATAAATRDLPISVLPFSDVSSRYSHCSSFAQHSMTNPPPGKLVGNSSTVRGSSCSSLGNIRCDGLIQSVSTLYGQSTCGLSSTFHQRTQT